MYTTPVVCKPKNNEWFVYFTFYCPKKNKMLPIKRSEGLNRIKDAKEKEAEFTALCEARTTWLKMGWNPIEDPKFIIRSRIVVNTDFENVGKWPINKALTHALEYKKLAPKSMYDYRKSVAYFSQASEKIGIANLPAETFTKSHVKAVFAHLHSVTGLSAKNYNKRLEHIKSIFTELEEWGGISYNPAHGLKSLITEQTIRFVTMTQEERAIYKAFMEQHCFGFYVFSMVEFYTGIRPAEILSLKVSDIDTENLTIHLKPFSNVVKNKKQRACSLPLNLLHLLKQIGVEKVSPNDYLFTGNDFLPGPKKHRSNYATTYWRIWVKERLGINKHLYAFKHLGADELINSGISEDDLVTHLGHSNRFITRRYTLKGMEQAKKKINSLNINF